MPDLGHELAFGLFLPNPASQAATVVRLAQVAEQQGLDLIGIQDHPYNPDLLDTWTLLSHLAAATIAFCTSAEALDSAARTMKTQAVSVTKRERFPTLKVCGIAVPDGQVARPDAS